MLREFLQWIWGGGPSLSPTTQFSKSFLKASSTFYKSADTWDSVVLADGKTHYLLKNDSSHHHQTIQRLLYLSRRCDALWRSLVVASPPDRTEEMRLLHKCIGGRTRISHIVQKPRAGGYDVRAYAHGSWVFLELPTFEYVENGSDGINLTEDRRRQTLWDIVLHELAHVAGYWEHDALHADCLAWLKSYHMP